MVYVLVNKNVGKSPTYGICKDKNDDFAEQVVWFNGVHLTIGITGAYTPRTKHGRIAPPQHDRTNARVYKCPVHSLVRRLCVGYQEKRETQFKGCNISSVMFV
jgi:hypothetical protein